ncbi:translation elongation factor 2, partial [Coemansia sp. RSA 2424]
IRGLMGKTANIRNVPVVTSRDDGQLALTDLLFAKGGINPPASSYSTAKPVVNSMYFELDERQMEDIAEKEQGNGFLISLVNSSSHDYTSADVAAALRVTDSVLVVADVVSGVPAQVEAALRMAHAELVKPVLLIDEVDRA